MNKPHSNTIDTAVLIAINTPSQGMAKTMEYLAELEFLAETLGIRSERSFIQNLERPCPRIYVGSGKLEEIKSFVEEKKIKYAIFDDELYPSQVRNISAEMGCEVLDRTTLIFQIFAMRARTAQAKIQVELAQYQYLLPRLKRMWTHLSRQQGGGANMRGPGEKELETDRRIAKTKIAHLKEQLRTIERQAATQRRHRENYVKVSLVGYTNVGKSTIMNLLSRANVLAENKLFATLDSTVRKCVIDGTPFLLADTVGFIRKLPHSLVECFKSTLAQVAEADLLLHVVDVSNPAYADHVRVVEETLREIGVGQIKTLLVLNKIDSVEESETKIEQIEQHFAGREFVQISAKCLTNVEAFKKLTAAIVHERYLAIYPNYLKEESGELGA